MNLLLFWRILQCVLPYFAMCFDVDCKTFWCKLQAKVARIAKWCIRNGIAFWFQWCSLGLFIAFLFPEGHFLKGAFSSNKVYKIKLFQMVRCVVLWVERKGQKARMNMPPSRRCVANFIAFWVKQGALACQHAVYSEKKRGVLLCNLARLQ